MCEYIWLITPRMKVPAVLPVVGLYVDNPAMTIVMRWGSRKKIPNQSAKRLGKEAWCVGFCGMMSGFLGFKCAGKYNVKVS